MVKVVNIISRGSYSTVYLTLENNVYKHFNNKKILGSLFIPLEISILRSLEHVNISPTIINYVCDKGKVTGYTMNKYDYDMYYFITKSSFDLPIEKKKIIFYQLLTAVYYLHEINVVHCDIKPSNIMLDINHNAFLCDFNSCHLMTPKKIESLCNLYTCTLWYRSPEILLNMPITHKCDIWSLGIVFSEILKKQCGIITNGYFYGEDNSLTSSFIYKHQCDYFKDSGDFIKFFNLLPIDNNDELCDMLKCMLAFDSSERYCAKMLLEHACFQDITIPKPSCTPLQNIENSNFFEKVLDTIVCLDYAVDYIKEVIKSHVKTSYRYSSLELLHNELLHFSHYILIYSFNYNKKESIVINKFVWCLIIALKIMDPYNDTLIEMNMTALDFEEETMLLIDTDFRFYFQNTLYYKVHKNIKNPSSCLLGLLDMSLYFNYPKECKNTDDVMQLLLQFSENKNTEHIYYKKICNKK